MCDCLARRLRVPVGTDTTVGTAHNQFIIITIRIAADVMMHTEIQNGCHCRSINNNFYPCKMELFCLVFLLCVHADHKVS